MIRELKNTDIEELTKLLINYDKNIENHFNFSYYLYNDILCTVKTSTGDVL